MAFVHQKSHNICFQKHLISCHYLFSYSWRSFCLSPLSPSNAPSFSTPRTISQTQHFHIAIPYIYDLYTRSEDHTQCCGDCVDQILNLISGVYSNITCGLNLLKTPPTFFIFIFIFFASSCSNAPPNIEIPQSNKTHPPLDIAYIYRLRAAHAAPAVLTPPRPQRPLVSHHLHHRLDLAPRV